MKINTPEEESQLVKKRVRVVAAATIIVALILLYVGVRSFIVYQTLEQSYGLEINTATDAVNTTEELYQAQIALSRAQAAIGHHAAKLVSSDDLTDTIDSAESIFLHFDPSNPIGTWLTKIDSYRPAYTSVQKHLKLASAYSKGENNLPAVYAAYEDAARNWSLLTTDAVTLGNISNLRRMTTQTLSIMAWMMGLCIIVLFFAVYAGLRLSRDSIGQFNRLKLLAITIGHDFKSPLQVIQSAGTFLNGDLSAADRSKYSSMILRSTATMARLLDDVLNVMLRSKLSINSVPTNIALWAENFSLVSKQKASNKGLGWHMYCKFSNIDTIIIDPDRLTQSVGNLVDNAIRYTESGAISLHIALGVTDHNGVARLTIQVEDTGPGIPDLDRKRIFEPFERITRNKNTPNGMGLGLTIVSNLVTAMGGEVSMTSEVGQGSSFKLSIPTTISLNPSPPKEVESEMDFKESTPPNPNAEILVVDDEESILTLVTEVLREASFIVDVAHSGNEAWDMVQAHAYKLVLTDIQMPGMSGIELARRIRESSNVIVIGMSAGLNLAQLNGDSYLMNALLSKPFAPDELFQVLERFEDVL
jgi:signal transduction histidine kinase/CheY-like chemotaxis protein